LIQTHNLNREMPQNAQAVTCLAVGPNERLRSELEAFVNAAFLRKHRAHVRNFMPTLLLWKDGGSPMGVVGMRAARDEPLYLEHYLGAPIEHVLAERAGGPVQRTRIVEVGHLASCNCLAAARIAAALPRYLLECDYEWIVFTATRTVRGILSRLGAPLHELAVASAGCVSGTSDSWGRYYDSDPRVCAGFLPDARRMPAFLSEA
jgi:hypothetical protein